MDQNKLSEILEQVEKGKVSAKDAQSQILGYEDLGFAKVDHDRQKRQGFCEVIYCASKTDEQILAIAKAISDRGISNILCTRISSSAAALLKENFDVDWDCAARTAIVNPRLIEGIGNVVIACAGTSDLPVAKEAANTARAMGANVIEIYDVGVAGIHRLLGQKDTMQTANVIVAVAGMEGALPSVIAGLVDIPVIAVPTSVGYGASFGGLAALLAMLNTCASGVSVVNIDNGFGAGYNAAIINKKCCLK